MLKPFALAAFAVAALIAADSSAKAGFTTPDWGCLNCGYKNGTQLTGVAREDASAHVVGAVMLPSGETLDLTTRIVETMN